MAVIGFIKFLLDGNNSHSKLDNIGPWKVITANISFITSVPEGNYGCKRFYYIGP
jgi:hypothetical protein